MQQQRNQRENATVTPQSSRQSGRNTVTTPQSRRQNQTVTQQRNRDDSNRPANVSRSSTRNQRRNTPSVTTQNRARSQNNATVQRSDPRAATANTQTRRVNREGRRDGSPQQRVAVTTLQQRRISDPGGRRTNRSGPPDPRIYEQDRDRSRVDYLERKRRVAREAHDHRDRQRQHALKQRRHDHHDNNDHRRVSHRRIHHHKHIHGHGCGHHYYSGRWHDYPSHHVHGRNCGHHYSSGSWISISFGHVHSIGCGHFYDNGVWLSFSGSHHVHGFGCGHYFWDGYWHNTARYHIHGHGCGHHYYNNGWHDFAISHVHNAHCGHVYDGATWLIIDGEYHKHGTGCGHYYFNRRWYNYPRSYYTMYQPNSFYFFIDLGDYRSRALPDYVYRERLSGYGSSDVFDARDPLSKAYAAFGNGRYYDALINFNRSIKQDPENGLLYLARAQAQIAVKDYRLAYEDLTRGMELIPEWADVDFTLGEIYSNNNDLAAHTEALERWVERYPRDYKAHFVLGYFYYFHQDYVLAKDELVYTLSWNPEHEQANALMSRILEREAESEVLTREPLDLDPNEEPVYTEE